MSRNDVLVNTDHTVVAGETVLLVGSQHAYLVRWEINHRCLDLTGLLFYKLAPRCDIWHRLERIGPLSAEQATRRVLKVKSKQESIILVKILSVHIWAEAHCLYKDLSEGIRV